MQFSFINKKWHFPTRPVVIRWCTWCSAPPIIPVIIGRWCSAPPKILMQLLKNCSKLNEKLWKKSVFCKKCTTNKNSITTGLRFERRIVTIVDKRWVGNFTNFANIEKVIQEITFHIMFSANKEFAP